MIVYVVFSGYEDVDAVFSTRKAAEEYIETDLPKNRWKTRESYSIVEFTLDVAP